MQKKIRRIIFVLATLIFIGAALFLISYSWGYRWDKEKFNFVSTGGLYLRVNNTKPEIYLNGKQLKKATPGLLSSGIFLSDLLPNEYLVQVKKDNYFSWSKKVVVQPKMVTTFSWITLLPKNPLITNIYPPSKLTANSETSTVLNIQEEIIDILPLPNNKEIIIQTKETATTTRAILSILNINNQNKTEIYQKKLAKNEELDLVSVLKIFDDDANDVLFSLTTNKVTNFYLWQRINPEEIRNISQIIISQFNLKNPITKIDFYPNLENKYIILTRGNLMTVDLNKNETKQIFSDVKDFVRKDYTLFWIDNKNAVYSYNLILNSLTPLGILELPKNAVIKKMEISPKNSYFALLFDDDSFYLFKAGEEVKKKEGIKLFAFSFDDKKLAYLNNNGELKVYYLSDVNGDVIYKKDEEIVITKGVFGVDNLVWFFDLMHLIYQKDKNIYFAEIDPRDKINIFEESFDFNNFILTSNKNGTIWAWRPDLLQKIDLVYENLNK